ncbi:MAG: replication initiation protein [Mariprofundales bacterium]|nr:replication initiation protein [Mariprofundales bacterium]
MGDDTTKKERAEIKQLLLRYLPSRPLATDNFRDGLFPAASKEQALSKKIIQLNYNDTIMFLVIDIDHQGQELAWSDENVAEPTYVVRNPSTLHVHYVYRLSTPVTVHGWSHGKSGQRIESNSKKWLAAIKRGYNRRLCADQNYTGLTTRNPVHAAHELVSYSARTYTLAELDHWLDPKGKAYCFSDSNGSEGRNSFIFHKVKQIVCKKCT